MHTLAQLTCAPLAAQLIEDFMRKNVAAAANVVMASPVFYFTFSAIVGETMAVSLVRALTGTMRIVPFMGVFYGAFAVISPFLVDYFMHENVMGAAQTYEVRARQAYRTPGIRTPCLRHAPHAMHTPWPCHAHGMRHARGPCPHPACAARAGGDGHGGPGDDHVRLRGDRGGGRAARLRRALLADDRLLLRHLHPSAG